MKQVKYSLFKIGFFTICCLSAKINIVYAQIIPDDTVNTKVNQNGKVTEITGGETRGNNLFHSFQEFSVVAGNEASFKNTNTIENIFSRVTGNKISQIDSLISASGNANLFLLNPAGIIFGEGARLNIGGSFLATTADSLLFPDGVKFAASDRSKTPLLTINTPIGLGVNNPGDITIKKANLSVASDRNLTLLGGNINLDSAKIIAPGSAIDLGSAIELGTITFNEDNKLTFAPNIIRGDISLVNGSEINVRAGDGGEIYINAKNLSLSDKSMLFGGIAEGMGNPNARAGDIVIDTTESLVISGTGSSMSNQETGIRNHVGIVSNLRTPPDSDSTALGNAGNIKIKTSFLEINNTARISSKIYNSGNAGNITIDAKKISLIDKSLILNQAKQNPFVAGNAGDIKLNADSIILTDGSSILTNTFGVGNAGRVEVNATESLTLLDDRVERDSGKTSISSNVGVDFFTVFLATGNAGGVFINTNNLLVDRSNLVSNTHGFGNAGGLEIQANNIDIKNDSFIFSRVLDRAEGNVEGININTENFSLNNSQISTEVLGSGNTEGVTIDALKNLAIDRGLILSQVRPGGNGNAGSIKVNADNATLTNFTFLSVKTLQGGRGEIGNIEFNTNSLTMTDSATLDAITETNAEGGNIIINTELFNLENNAKVVSSTSGSGKAGDIILNADRAAILSTKTIPIIPEELKQAREESIRRDDLLIDLLTGGLFATTNGSTGGGGNIKVKTPKLTIADTAIISVNSEGKGVGGNIDLDLKTLNIDRGSITAQTRSTQGGNINLNIDNNLQFKNQGQISATAGTDRAGGNGGNVNINSDFTLAFSTTNKYEITAEAFSGNGGKIQINTTSILGQQNIKINASSATGINGTIAVETPDVDPTSGIFQLPDVPIDAAEILAQDICKLEEDKIAKGSSFIITGKGGVTPTAADSSDNIDRVVNWASRQDIEVSDNGVVGVRQRENKDKLERNYPVIRQSQGWVKAADGSVWLVANTPKTILQNSAMEHPSCGKE